MFKFFKRSNPALIMIVVSLYFFYEYIQMTMFNSLSFNLFTAYKATAYQISILSSAYFFSQIILIIPAGLIIDKIPLKKVILSTFICSIIGTVMLSFSYSLLMAIISRLVTGISGAFAFLCCLKLLSITFNYKRISLVIGLLVTFGLLGGVCAQVPLAWALNYLNWRHLLYVISLMGFLIWILLYFFIKEESKIDNQSDINQTTITTKIILAVKNRQTIIGGLYISLMNFPVFILGALWGGFYLHIAGSFTTNQSAIIISSLFLGLMIGSPIIGFIVDILINKRKYIMFLGSFFSFLVILLIQCFVNSSILNLSILFFLLGFFSSVQCLGYPIIIENNPHEIVATASSIGSIIVMGGGVLSKILFSLILDYSILKPENVGYLHYSKLSLNYAMLIIPLSFLIAMLLIPLIKKQL